MPITSPGLAQILILTVRPHVNDKGLPTQRLNVLANGFHIAEFSLSGPTTRACIIPREVLGNRTGLDLTFETPDAAAPSAYGGSNDRRLLAVAFSRLSIRPETPAPPGGFPLPSSLNVTDTTMQAAAEAANLAAGKLMLRFESLGENCEFGLVQRNFNAEPLGIFRFSSTPLPRLLQALENEFHGLGEPGTITVDISANGKEFMVKDRTYGFLYHAWVKTGEETAEAVEERERRRLPFLKRKLLEDLVIGEKMFVFHAMRRLPVEEVFPLAALLRCYGPNTLLFVTLADEHHPAGTVELQSPGFLIGYLDRFAEPDNAADASFEAWASICRAASQIHQAASLGGPT